MRGKNTFSGGLTQWAGRITGLTGLLLLFVGAAFGQATFVGNNFVIPTGAPTTTSGQASGTVAVACVGQIANGASISVSINNTHTFEGDLSYWLVAPGGQVLELCTRNGGGNNNFNVTFSDAAATNIGSAVATTSTTTLACGAAGQTFAYNGSFRPEGRVNVIPAFPTSPSNVPAVGTFTFANTFTGINADGTWTLIINDHVGGDAGATCNWSITFAGVNVPSCTFVGAPTLQALNIGMDPGTCASQPISVPQTQGSCATQNISYSINGGAFVAVPANATTIDPNLATGVYTITWQVVNQCFQVATATQQVTVNDNENPTFTSCPSDIIVNLAPGLCGAFVNFDVDAYDNCGLLVQNSGQPGYAFPLVGAGGIGVTGPQDPGGFMFDIQNLTPYPMLINSIEIRFGPTSFAGPATGITTPVSVYYTTAAATYVGNTNTAGNWTQVGGAPITVTVGPQNGNSVVNLPTPINLAAGQSRGIYVFGNQFCPVYNNAGLSTAVAQNINGELSLVSGVAQGTVFGAPQFGPPRSPQVRFNYAYGPGLLFTVNQTDGPVSGSFFEVGSTFISFKATDASNNMATCSFNVIVNEFPNPISALACNDLVYVSLDENCYHELGADDVLEGGPYGCYDDYIVEVDKTAPFGNGPWLPAVFGPADIGKTYQVRVTDPDTGNKCWGNAKVEDKLAPVLDCPTVSLPCNADVAPDAVQPLVTKASANFAIPASGAVVVNIPVAGVNAPLDDLNITFVTDHTWVGDINATLTSPSGTSVVFFDRPGVPAAGLGCDGDGLDVGFDDEAAATYAEFEATCANNPAISGVFQPANALSAFDGEDPNGTWVLVVNDFVGGDGGPNSSISLSIGQTGGAGFPNGLVYNVDVFAGNNATTFVVPAGGGIPQLDNCSDVTLTYLDTQIPQNCASGLTAVINRKWTAKDASNNTSTCIQTINLIRPTLADVVPPSDYDDIDAPAFHCTDNAYPTPDWIEGQGLQGWPYVFGVPEGCSIGWTYEDIVLDVCDGTYKIRRVWSIIDWCLGDGFEYNQIIKVLDDQGPSFDC
ncbi:MAG: proprotein convertase P-domain-containing protein, partial [Saprospiraceae bacterium]|nr:proprotein convertase P-domain-containing protein [Saprospiraceae bacterium]